MKKERKHLKTKLQNLLNSAIDYWSEMEYNIFRVKQISRFALILTMGAVFFIFMHSLLLPEQWKWYWKLMGAYFFPPAGKETIIPLGLNRGIPETMWGFSIWVFDLMMCTTVLTNWWLIQIIIKYIKPVHRRVIKLQKRTQSIKEKKYGMFLPAILLLFMIIPFQGSGAISTAFIGTWLGFRPREILIMVAIGSLISTIFVMIVYYNILDLL